MTDQTCKCCGQTLPPPRPKGLFLSPGYNLIYDRVRRAGEHGVQQEALFNYIYSNTLGSGPESGMVTLRTRICYLNKRLRKFGIEIRSLPSRGYVVREIPA